MAKKKLSLPTSISALSAKNQRRYALYGSVNRPTPLGRATGKFNPALHPRKADGEFRKK